MLVHALRLVLMIAAVAMVAAVVACGDATEQQADTRQDARPDLTDVMDASDELDALADLADIAGDADTDVDAADAAVRLRMAGERAPLTAPCEPTDPALCFAPWPSDRFTAADATTTTGLRLELSPLVVPEHDEAASFSRSDGHSRLTPLVTVFAGRLDADTLGDGIDGAVRLVVSEPGEDHASLVPLRFNTVYDDVNDETVIVAYPRVPLVPASEHVAVVLDDLSLDDGGAPPRDDSAAVSLGLFAPEDETEMALWAYHAPTREALAAADIAVERILRLWTFTTRSADNHASDLLAARQLMLDALDSGAVGVQLDEVALAPDPTVALRVQGRLTGLAQLVSPDEGGLYRDEQGRLEARGERDGLFRVVVPVGDGDYRIVMYAHGTGGDVSDPAFDEVITAQGAAKVSVQFDDWTDEGLFDAIGGFGRAIAGSDRVAARLIEGLAIASAVQRSLDGELGELLAAEIIGELDNPVAGRAPDTAGVVWAGGSLGGVTGMVYAIAEPAVDVAVLNVPGAGFSHFLRFSDLYSLVELFLQSNYPTAADVEVAIAMAQVNLDRVDGGAWAGAAGEDAPVFLIQESIGDPVLPNIGGDLVATSAGAVQVGEPLAPIWGVERVELAEGVTAITQYRVDPSLGALQIHGFADRDGPAGEAAQEQIREFITSYWQGGTPRIRVPSGCPDNRCDFAP